MYQRKLLNWCKVDLSIFIKKVSNSFTLTLKLYFRCDSSAGLSDILSKREYNTKPNKHAKPNRTNKRKEEYLPENITEAELGKYRGPYNSTQMLID